jgi:rubredoxin
MAKAVTKGKKAGSPAKKPTVSKTKTTRPQKIQASKVPKKGAVKPKPGVKGKKAKGAKVSTGTRYKCRMCGYIYSPLRGEPHNRIPAGTEFDDLPDTYVCPVCGFQGKGRVGKWGFDEWLPTKYICSMCSYIYDEARGEPHRGIRPGTKFEDLPDDYRCPVCALDPKISKFFGKVLKQGFSPLDD